MISRVCRFAVGNEERFGAVVGDKVYEAVSRGAGSAVYRLSEVRLLPPVMPSKIICLGYNYAEHAKECDVGASREPVIFLKPSTAVIGPGDPIVLPAASRDVHCEGEMGVVIGRAARNVTRDEALEYVYGYVCANDVSAKDIQRRESLWTRAKSFDTFAPIGPFIAMGDIDPANLVLRTKVNGRVYQEFSTGTMVFGVAELIEYISGIMTLLPGDVIFTGTGANAPEVDAGDVVEVEIEGIGSLKNPVVRTGS